MSEDKAIETKPNLDDLEILEELKQKIYNAIMDNKTIPKVGDLLKIIEMKNKLSISGRGEKKFWNMIDEIRQKELPNSGNKTKPARKKQS